MLKLCNSIFDRMGAAPSCFSASNVQMVQIIPTDNEDTIQIVASNFENILVETRTSSEISSSFGTNHRSDLLASRHPEDVTVHFMSNTDEEVWSTSTTPPADDDHQQSLSKRFTSLKHFVGWEICIAGLGVGLIERSLWENESSTTFLVQLQDGRKVILPVCTSSDFSGAAEVTLCQKMR